MGLIESINANSDNNSYESSYNSGYENNSLSNNYSDNFSATPLRGDILNPAMRTYLRNDIMRNGFSEKNFTLSNAINDGNDIFNSHMNFNHVAGQRQHANSQWELNNLQGESQLIHNSNNHEEHGSRYEVSNYERVPLRPEEQSFGNYLQNDEREDIMGKDKISINKNDMMQIESLNIAMQAPKRDQFDSQISQKYNYEKIETKEDVKVHYSEYSLNSHREDIFAKEHDMSDNVHDIFNINNGIVAHSLNQMHSIIQNKKDSENIVTAGVISNIYEKEQDHQLKIDDISLDDNRSSGFESTVSLKEDFKDLHGKLMYMKTKRKRMLLEKLDTLITGSINMEEKSKYTKMHILIEQSIEDK